MESLRPASNSNSNSAQLQISSFVSLDADDEMAQLILEVCNYFKWRQLQLLLYQSLTEPFCLLQELSYMRRSFTGVAAEIASSPSSASTGLNAISEDEEEEED